MKALTTPIRELQGYIEAKEVINKKAGMALISGCTSSSKTHMMYAMSDGFKYKIIVCSGETRARNIYEEISLLEENTFIYPAKDLLFYHADLRSKDLLKVRMEVFKAAAEDKPLTVIASIEAFMDGIIPKEEFINRRIRLAEGDSLDFEKLKIKLVGLGYERVEQVEGIGQFSVRGGILDVFPLTLPNPIRVEFWGDEIDSIREFDIATQRSIDKLEEVLIGPATELIEEDIKRVSFLDYFSNEETAVFIDEPARVIERGEEIEEEFIEASKRRALEGYEATEAEVSLFKTSDIVRKLKKYSLSGFSLLDSHLKGFDIAYTNNIGVLGIGSYRGSFEMLTRDLKKYKKEGYRVILLSTSRTRARRIAEDLLDYNLNSFYSEDMEREIKAGEVMVTKGYVHEGYVYPILKYVVISESDVFGKPKKAKSKTKKKSGMTIGDFNALKVGDYVVHENHGLGKYQGIEKIETGKIAKDYMKIQYAGSGVLYIPATSLDLIQKYSSGDAKKPTLNKLGTGEWQKTHSRVKKAVELVADDLVELYAKRREHTGYVYEKDTPWQTEFEELFPYDETEDQFAAIEAVKADMESTKIMDRLICGDVGYGKTEIAIRAAFKAALENKQVVYLVPTTILAQQHYNTFVQRMKEFPVRIDLMCRFRTAAQQRKTIQDLQKGLVDIVIGTHRLLSDDVKYKDLGLLIIDEEQRFGVRHKEKIKLMRENVDVITLTATPIPRTLHMSLIGIRDMSVLEEAPGERFPIQTYVLEHSEEMVREAIERELSREGQVYYVYNRVEDIADVAGRISRLVPEASVAYVHGQMTEHKLEKIMYQFIEGEIDVLVATTIIETGLDISNVNTMIIQNADRLGLSQLYQLRGRVGRSNRMAYAFLMYGRDKILKEVAEKRLAAIREFTDLGSGYKIAVRDLEIRGAGSLLGEAQSGNMQAVGYDLYVKMLSEAIKKVEGTLTVEESFTTSIDINVDAHIPASYIVNEYQKLDVYKRIAAVSSDEELDELIEEIIDRFGDIPRQVETLLNVARVKILAHSLFVTDIEQKNDEYTFTMYPEAPFDTKKIPELIESFNGDLTITSTGKPKFIYYKKPPKISRKRGNLMENLAKLEKEEPMQVVKKVLEGLKSLINC